ncbi:MULTISPECIES: alpha/beta family hydrolase [Microbacterium]|uniref:alpha/beta hydrolase family protein n=1 Tax=Microbacterium TaxID=33882 RepID=UPI0027808CBF|nr:MULTISPECIES: alpha/beta family hydrolase [Microbacterium]MDQ1083818.1 putative alpha/beta-hydrolase family hydrolase [Microbacterium sp. SORGH_AS_0344]MDQ1170903.1 putative alpha/beta-hydrolase family hydrolase [Microbacterium proteolyticum]
MSAAPVRLPVELPAGASEVSGLWSPAASARATVALAHGAGAGMDHPFLAGLADALCADEVSVLRFVFPYVEAGRRMPGPAAHAVATWRGVEAWLGATAPGPWTAVGKSYGGRMASMACAEGVVAPAALVYLGYPLHPPGRPEKPRSEHLPGIAVPQLFVEGENDPFIDPRAQFDEVIASCQDARVHWIASGNHSFEVKGARRPAVEIGAGLAPVVGEFVRGV